MKYSERWSDCQVRVLVILFLTNISQACEVSRENMPPLTNLPPIARLSNKIIRILGCNPGPMTLQGTNTYLIGTGHRRVLIDSGEAQTGEAYTKLLDNVLREENATIEHVLITHWHHDHIGGVEPVRSLLKKLFPESEQPTVWKLPRASHDDERSKDEISIQWQPLQDEQVVEVEGAKLQVKYTPGHSTDHACLLLQDEHVLFSGDCILGEGTTVFEDLHEYLLSLEKILKIQPKVIYPGHGSVVNNPLTHIEYYIHHRQQREAEILQIFDQQSDDVPIADIDIVKQLYKDIPDNLLFAATWTVRQHLTKLQKEGKVFQSDEGDWYRVRGKL